MRSKSGDHGTQAGEVARPLRRSYVNANPAVFGLMHAYQGWKDVSVICFLGALFGMVAAWRRSTRPGMIVHAMADIWGGWLKGALHFPY